jgi:hypothetical protein
MNSGDEFVNQLRVLEKNIQDKLEKLRKPIAQLEADLQHIQGTIAICQRNDNKTITESEETVTEVIPRLKGLNHADAVVAIAKHNGGIVRTQEAKRIMIKAGIMSRTKNSTNMAHNAIKRSERFEKVSPGEYRLKQGSVHVQAIPERETLPLRPPVN